MSLERDNAMWRRIEAALTPSPDELSSADREIGTLHGTAPPSMQSTEWMRDATEITAREQKRRVTRLHVSAAATFLLATASLAWVGTKIVWPRQAPLIWSATTIEASEALRSPDSDDSDWGRALGYFNGRYGSCVQTLLTLANPTEAAALDAATQQAAIDAIRRHVDGIAPAASNWHGSIEEAVGIADDPNADSARRCDAVAYIEHFLRHVEQTMASVSADTETRAAKHSAYSRILAATKSRLQKTAESDK